MRSTKAHLHSVTSVISIPMQEENHTCDANSAGVLVNVAFCIPHTAFIRAGSFGDSNLALCDPQIGGGEEEVCALECVCLDGPSEIYIFLMGETTAGCDLQNVITDDGRPSSLLNAVFFLMFLCPKPVPPALPALIYVHVQVELCAQVEVEKRVDAEDEEQDRHDDQERILQDRARHNLYFSLVRCPHTQERLCFVGIITGEGRGGLLLRICGVSLHLQDS